MPTSATRRRDRRRPGRSMATPSSSSTSAAPHVRRRGPVAVLDHRRPGAGDHDRRHGRDVDGVGRSPPVPTMSTAAPPARTPAPACASIVADQAGDLGGGLALGPQRDREAGDWAGVASPVMTRSIAQAVSRAGQVGALRAALVSSPARSAEVARSVSPSLVGDGDRRAEAPAAQRRRSSRAIARRRSPGRAGWTGCTRVGPRPGGQPARRRRRTDDDQTGGQSVDLVL